MNVILARSTTHDHRWLLFLHFQRSANTSFCHGADSLRRNPVQESQYVVEMSLESEFQPKLDIASTT